MPLTLTIQSLPDQRIRISNNLQRKQREVFSNKVGLNNILQKYEWLGRKGVAFDQTDSEFVVYLPLISN
jgi:hypothetical protein